MYKPREAGLKRFVHNTPDGCSPMHYSPSQTKSSDSHYVGGGRGRTDNRGKSLIKKQISVGSGVNLVEVN